MKGKQFLIIGLVLVLLALALGLTQAQGPEPEGEVDAEGEVGAAAVGAVIPIQGRLTDANGTPLDGTHTITFTLYTSSGGGTILCQDEDPVDVNNGLFNAYMDHCTSADINGQQLYLGIQVGGDPEMTPRKPIYPVPYAWSLRPGAVISNTSSGTHGLEVWSNASSSSGTALWVENSNTSSGIALWAVANGSDASVIASNRGDGALFKGFGGDGGEHEFIVENSGDIWTEGDVSQSQTADGLVKAAVVAECGNAGSTVYRSFNNVGGTIIITNGASAGQCTIDFGFGITGRYFAATAIHSTTAYGISCAYHANGTSLKCFRWNAAGNGANGPIVVMVY